MRSKIFLHGSANLILKTNATHNWNDSKRRKAVLIRTTVNTLKKNITGDYHLSKQLLAEVLSMH